jgi:hypothetical protein
LVSARLASKIDDLSNTGGGIAVPIKRLASSQNRIPEFGLER